MKTESTKSKVITFQFNSKRFNFLTVNALLSDSPEQNFRHIPHKRKAVHQHEIYYGSLNVASMGTFAHIRGTQMADHDYEHVNVSTGGASK